MRAGIVVGRQAKAKRRSPDVAFVHGAEGFGHTPAPPLNLRGGIETRDSSTIGRLRQSILIVEDDLELANCLAKRLRTRGWSTLEATSCKRAVSLASEYSIKRALVDIRLPDGSGLDLVDGLAQVVPGIEVVVTTGYPSIASCVEAIHKGALDYLPKPVSVNAVLGSFGVGQCDLLRDGELHSLDRMEWEYINFILSRCGWNISRSAQALGISRTGLQRRLKKYPLLE